MPTDRASGGRPLRDVYSVCLGVALVLAVEQVIDLERSGVPIRAGAVLPFLAFTATGFALYHWATRFVDLFFEGSGKSATATVAALAVGATELLLLIALSILIARPVAFLGGLTLVIGFEVVAGLVLTRVRAYEAAADFGRRYLLLNAAALVLAGAAFGVAVWLDRDALTGGLALAVAAARTVAFYRAGFRILFPELT